MRRVTAIPADVVDPERADVLLGIGMDGTDRVSARLEDLLERAAAMFTRVAAPALVFESVTHEEFAAVYDGAGANASATPLDIVFPRAEHLALFTATLGSAIDHTIHDEFRVGDPALAYVLDVTASGAADRLAHVAAEQFLTSVSDAPSPARLRALPYNPGYCGWHVSGQRALFSRLRPREIHVALTTGCVMDPVKSVSGVLVAGRSTVHRFRPAFPFCASCATHACRARMASVK